MRCVLLCNSIVIDKGCFKCDSPDELCLVSYCAELGGKLVAKSGKRVTIAVNGASEEWVVDKELAFSSERKRMSVLARQPDTGRHVVFSKVGVGWWCDGQGADDMMLARSLKQGERRGVALEKNFECILACLQEYADKGLRTLVMGEKELTEAEYAEAMRAIDKAEKVLNNREEAKAEWCVLGWIVRSSYESIETKFVPLGVSGIEDLLQDDVADTIQVSLHGPCDA